MAHSDDDPPDTLDTVIDREIAFIRSQRREGQTQNAIRRSLIGLALSGGGIRSATTNLGVLQSLSRMDILPMVDYLSTVSGGGYVGACLTSLLSWNGARIPSRDDRTEAFAFSDSGSKPPFSTDWQSFPFRQEFVRGWDTRGDVDVAHLRTHGNFLINRFGFLRRETLRGIGTVVLGTAFNFGYFLLTLFAAATLYMALVLSMVPKAPDALHDHERARRIYFQHHPLIGADSSQIRVMTGGCPLGEPACVVERRTTLREPTLLQRFNHNIFIARVGFWSTRVREHLLWAAVLGAAFASVALLAMLLVVRHRTRKESVLDATIAPGDSAEDRAERRLLQWVTFTGFLWVCALVIGLYQLNSVWSWNLIEQVAFLWTTFAAVSGMWIVAFVFNAAIPSLSRGNRRRRSVWHAFHALSLYAVILGLLIAVTPLLVYAMRDYKFTIAGGAASAALVSRFLVPRVLGGNGGRFSLSPPTRNMLLGIAITIAVALTFLVFAALASRLHDYDGIDAKWMGYPLLALLVLGFLVSQNKLSLHDFYRDRLAETYLFTERADTRGGLHLMRDAMEMRLQDLHGTPPPGSDAATQRKGAPYHLISAAINLAGSRSLTRKDRKSGYWLFSKLFCGSTHTGFRPTEKYHQGRLTVATAVAVSGAAASSAAGFNTFFAQAFAAAIFNIRLGVWLDNPMKPMSPNLGPWRRHRRLRFWPWWLAKEMAMRTTEHDTLVNVSDGGHTGDNLGIYPLLERRCKVIIACDAECDAGLTFGSFTEAMRHAYVDMGISIDIDLTMLRADPVTGLSRSHCAVGRIRYPDRPTQASYLIYLKNSLTGDEPEPILNYKTRSRAFPHETTADQFFTDAQFESYRALGVHIAEDTFGDWVSSEHFSRLFDYHGRVAI